MSTGVWLACISGWGCRIPWDWSYRQSWVTMWVLELNPVSSERAVSVLNCWASGPFLNAKCWFSREAVSPWLWLHLLYDNGHQVQQATEVKWSLQLTNIYLLNKAIYSFCFWGDFLFCFVWDRVSLYSPGCPGTHSADQTNLWTHRDPHVPPQSNI